MSPGNIQYELFYCIYMEKAMILTEDQSILHSAFFLWYSSCSKLEIPSISVKNMDNACTSSFKVF